MRAGLSRALALGLVIALLSVSVPQTAQAKSKSPGMAFLLSLASTLIPIGIAAGLWATGDGLDEDVRLGLGMTFLGLGSIVGPSVGAIYTEDTGEAVLTMLLRAATGSVMLSGIGVYARGDQDKQTLGTALTVVGAIPTGLIALYDFWTVPGKARASDRAARTVAQMDKEPRLGLGSLSLCRAVGSIAPCWAATEPTLSFSQSLRLQTFQ